jgi:glucosamine-6-phosphate deaminase
MIQRWRWALRSSQPGGADFRVAFAVPSPSVSFRLVSRPDPLQLIEAVVDHWERRLRERLELREPKPLGLATGRTMEPFYRQLIDRLQGWPEVERQRLIEGWLSFNLDEYVGMESGSAASFAATMQHSLGHPLGLDPTRLRLPDGAAVDPEAEAGCYARELARAGGLGVQLLGLGGNGHVGFNEPPCGADTHCRVVQLSRATRIQNAAAFGGDPQRVPPQAITLGIGEILQAEEIHLVVTGAGKAAILGSLLRGGETPELPASWLCTHPRFHLWADAAALSADAISGM